MIGQVLKRGMLLFMNQQLSDVQREEEDCVPVLEKFFRVKFNKDFFCGYSPEKD